MTKILIEDLKTSLQQDFTINRRHAISAVRPWIYKHLSPAGDFNIELIQNGQTVGTSETITSNVIEANSDATSINYFHGFYRFSFSTPVVLNRGTVTVKLVASGGYSWSSSAYLGWVKPHENKIFTESYTPSGDVENTFGLQFWEYRENI